MLLVVALVAMLIVIRPGAGLDSNRSRRDVPCMILSGLFLVTQLQQLAALTWFDDADPTSILLARLGRPLAENAVVAAPIAAGLALLLYRAAWSIASRSWCRRSAPRSASPPW